ncbi:uncharacterized protein [Dermacentor andersoni]|uniref:uncharacterized protein n=1 Tax=Dermacentor andersoni TaxID=34620 RepID=UPI00241621B2|nr:uncharacterized protein LOC126543993 [Dermacentor andersoni]
MRFFSAVFQLLAIAGLSLSFASVNAANTTSEDSCEDIQLPNVESLNTCLGQNNTSCETSQDLIDDVGPLVKCVYGTLADHSNNPGDALIAYADIIYKLMNASEDILARMSATNFMSMVGLLKAGTINLTGSGDSKNVSLPTAVIGQCHSDFGTSCESSTTSIASSLVSLVECLVDNAIAGSSGDKTMTLVCDLIARTDMDALTRAMPLLWSVLFSIKPLLCK